MLKKWFNRYVLSHMHNTVLHPLHKVAISGLVILVIISAVSSNIAKHIEEHAELMLSAVLPSVVVELTNVEREAQNLNSLVHSSSLDEAARLKAEHMIENEYFKHYSSDGVSPWYWFKEVGYDYAHAGENLAIYFDETKDVMEAWMESPLHKENILKSEYTEIGVAAVEGEYKGYDTVYVVQLFGTPAVKSVNNPVVTKVTEEIKLPVEVDDKKQEVIDEVPEGVVKTESVEVGDVNDIDDVEVKEVEVLVAQKDVQETLTYPVMSGKNLIYMSDHISTSTGKVSAPVMPSTVKSEHVSMPGGVAPETQAVLQMMYTMMAFVVFGLIVVSIVSSERKLQHAQAVYGVMLLVATLTAVLVHTQFVLAFVM